MKADLRPVMKGWDICVKTDNQTIISFYNSANN